MFAKKYKKKIKDLEDQIRYMSFEWNDEKKLYTKKVRNLWFNQKVDYVIGNIDLSHHKEIHRPMYGLTDLDATEISRLKILVVEQQGYTCKCTYHWRESERCYVIDLTIIK